MRKEWKNCEKCKKRLPISEYRNQKNGAGKERMSARCKNCDRINFSTRILIEYQGNKNAHSGDFVSICTNDEGVRIIKLPPASANGADFNETILPDWRRIGGHKL